MPACASQSPCRSPLDSLARASFPPTDGLIPSFFLSLSLSLSPDVSRVGVSEKGYVTVKVTARGETGHASMSPRETAIVKLSKVLSRYVTDVTSAFPRINRVSRCLL